MDEEYVSMREAQEILGISNYTIWKMVRDGRLTAYQSNVDRRRKLIKRADLDALQRISPVSAQETEKGKAAARTSLAAA